MLRVRKRAWMRYQTRTQIKHAFIRQTRVKANFIAGNPN